MRNLFSARPPHDAEEGEPHPGSQADAGADAGEDSLGALLRGLIAALGQLWQAEIAYQRARARALAGMIGMIAALLVAAVILALALLVAVSVGLVWALTARLGAWGAMGAVALGLLLLLALVLVLAGRMGRRIARVIFGGGLRG
ncbi:MAG TPA: hypothetical protein VFF98_06615 [Novosphingobium sp.]|nr:hypothetical protein [Novosphingobium sp.]